MKILAIQNKMGIGDMVIYLPFIDAISKKSNELLEFACTKRAKEIIQIRQKGKVQ